MDGQHRSERGAVVVFVAVLILPLTMLMAFAIDTGNWWVHHGHLQTQADAGTLAGAQGPWVPACDETAIETAAQQYAGSSYNQQYTPSGSVHVLLNSTNYWPGGANFSDGGTPCQNMAASHGFLDLKVTEAGLANIFGAIPGFSSVTVHTHARVEIQAVKQESGLRPIAFGDPALYKCAEAQLWTADSSGNTSSLLATVNLPNRTVLPNGDTQFQNPSGSGPITLPTGQNVAATLLLGNTGCANTAAYPESVSTGLNFINVYNSNGVPPSGSTPRVHGVSMPLGSSNCSPDPYFSSAGSCSAAVQACVDFASNVPPAKQAVSVNGTAATAGGGCTGGGTSWTANVAIAAQSGASPITITWTQTSGTVPNGKKTQTCTAGKPCSGDFSCSGAGQNGGSNDCVEQQAYASDLNTLPIGLFQIGELGASSSGANSFAQGTSHNFVFTLDLKGLQNSKPTDPPYVLHADASQATGLVDCGQGNSDSGAKDAMANGCPRPIYLYTDGTSCVDAGNSNAPAPIDCVQSVPGKKSMNILDGINTRISNTCNNWNGYRDSGTPIPANDPRLVDIIIVEPPILSHGTDMPVRVLATFYITGVDGQSGVASPTGCQNDAAQSHEILGHWIKWVSPGGIGNGTGCNPNAFGDCVAVLTQ
jgi:hypothetical protein